MSIVKLLFFTLIAFWTVQSSLGDDHLQNRARYHLRSGDSLTLEYRFTPEFNQSVTIQPDGYVSLGIIGELKVIGLTLAQVHDLILQGASSRLNGPELNLVLKESETPYVTVSGEVDKPGRIDFQDSTTALQAILLSGGFKGTAQRSQVLVFRKVNETVSEIIYLDLHRIKSKMDLEHDLALKPGDIVLVPRNKDDNMASLLKNR